MYILYIIIGILGLLSAIFSVCLYRHTRKKLGYYVEKQTDLYSKIIDNMPFPVMLKDVNDDFKYIYWNKQCDILSGYDRNDVLGKTDFDIYGQEMGCVLRNKDIDVVNSGDIYTNQEQFVTPDGVIHDTIVSKVLLENEYTKWVLAVRWDITDLATVQRSLALANNQLKLAFASGNITPWIWDIPNNKLFFGIDDGSGSDSRIVTPRYIVERVHPEDRGILIESLNKLREGIVGKVNFVVRFDLEQKFDKYYNIFSIIETLGKSGNAERIIGFMQDVTEQTMYERELVIANKKIELVNKTNHIILNNTEIGLAFITPDYIVQWENLSNYIDHDVPKSYKVGECCYKSTKSLKGPCEGCVVSKAFESKCREEKEVIYDGSTIQIVASPVLDAENNCQGVVMKVKDITEDRKRENDLREAKERAEKSDKLKSAFLANMSHEIRTPLNAILGFSELLSITDDQSVKKEYMQVINSNNELLLHLINDILDLSKIEANTLEFIFTNVNINDMMIELERSFCFKKSSEELEIVFEKPFEEESLYTDRNRIQQVISNFITNALKFTSKGRVAFGCERRGDNAYFYVSDTGIGIPEDKLDDIFKRFTKLNSFKTGTGLGLTICQTIVNKLKGQIGVYSELDKGSTFWFTIPITVDNNLVKPFVEELFKNEPIEVLRKENKDGLATLLIAEDTIDNYKLYNALLGKKYNLIHAWNGIEAVNLFTESSPAAILMDIKMPEMDGYEATAAIRNIDTGVPIIAVTAFASELDKKQIANSGFTDFLAKPIRAQDLYDVLSRINL